MLRLFRFIVLPSSVIGLTLASTVLPGALAAQGRGPKIVSHPQSQSLPAGATAVFNVSATGEGRLYYRWFLNGTLVRFATEPTLVVSNISPAHAGNYSALVFNSSGATLSEPATLTVAQSDIPVITEQPQSATVAAGAEVTLAVDFSGSGPVHFQWRRNGVSIAGATNQTFTITSVQPGDAGEYSVVLATDAGAVMSATAAIRVPQASVPFQDNFPAQSTITTGFGSGRASNAGATAEQSEPLHAGKPGGRSVWLSWQPNVSGIATISLAGSSFDTLLAVYTGSSLDGLAPIAADDDSAGFLASRVSFNVTAGTLYRIAVDGLAGASGEFAFAWSVEQTADRLPRIITQPFSQTVAPGDSVVFVIEAAGANLSYQWLFNGQPLPGEINSALSIGSVDANRVGLYSVRVISGSRSVESAAASLQINVSPQGAQAVLSADKLADAIRLNQPLRLGEESAAAALVSDARVAAAPGVNRGYTGSQIFSTFGAVSEPGEPLHCGIQGGASHWIVYVADQDGELDLNTDGSAFDTILAVYRGSGSDYASLQSIDCDNNSGNDGRDSRVKVRVQRGQVYFIVVDGVNGAHGAVQLNYSLATPATLTVVSRTPTVTRLRLSGQKGGLFVVECSNDTRNWMEVATYSLPNGVYEFTHAGAAGQCLYRARTLQP